MEKMHLRKWFKKHIKKIFIFFSLVIFVYLFVYLILNTKEFIKIRFDLKYNKINELIIDQKNKMINSSLLYSDLYPYSVDNEKTLENLVVSEKSLAGIIDYKPTFDYINAKYPSNMNVEDEIKNIIKQNLKNIVDNKSYKIIENENIIYVIVPYYYELLENNDEIFQGILIFEYSEDKLINEIRNILNKNEYILSISELESFHKNFIKKKKIKFYTKDYYLVSYYADRIKEFIYAIIISFGHILIFYYIIKTLELKNLEKKIIYPIEDFTKHIEKYDDKTYDKSFELYEFERLRQTYNNLITNLSDNREELEASLEETSAMNEELISLNKNLEEYIGKFDSVIKIIGSLNLYNKDEQKFFDKLLEISIKNLPEIDYGSITLKENNKWKFVSAYGHDVNKLKDVEFNDDEFIFARDTIVINNILEKDEKMMSEKNRSIIKEASNPIAKSILSPLKAGNYIIGQISLDSKRNIEIPEETIKFVNALSTLSSFFVQLNRISREQGEFHKDIILTLIKALEYYDKYTKGHSERVAKYATEFAEYINMGHNEIKDIYWSAIMHDVGKFFVPQNILNKPDKLSDEEYKIIKEHPVKSFELLVKSKYLKKYAKIVRHHHERWDGKGYPDGISDEKIPLNSRIITLADSFDAMITIRPYKKALNVQEAIEDIQENAGKQFDPELAEKFIEYLRRKYL